MTISIENGNNLLAKGDYARAAAAFADFISSAEYAAVDSSVLGMAYYGALLASYECKSVLELRLVAENDISEDKNYINALKYLDDEQLQGMLWQTSQEIKDKIKKKETNKISAQLTENQKLIDTDLEKAEAARRDRKRKRVNAEHHIADVKTRQRYRRENSRKAVKITVVAVIAVCVLGAAAFFKITYDDALNTYTTGNFSEAVPKLMRLRGIGDSGEYLASYYGKTVAAGKYHSVIIRRAGYTDESAGISDIGKARKSVNKFFDTIEALQSNDITALEDYAKTNSGKNTTGNKAANAKKSAAQLSAIGDNKKDQCEVLEWEDIASVTAGTQHTAGLTYDGRVVAVGDNSKGQCNTDGWSNIVQITAGGDNTYGVTANNKVVGAGDNSASQLELSKFTNAVQVAAGEGFVAVLDRSGKVKGTGDNSKGQLNVQKWSNIIYIAAGTDFTVGLRDDGTVVATGNNTRGQCDTAEWSGITAVAAGGNFTLALRGDGTVTGTGDNSKKQLETGEWTGVAEVAAGYMHSIGLKTDGTAVMTGLNNKRQIAQNGYFVCGK